MRRGQISIDFLFAVTLVMITMLNVVYIATSEKGSAETLDTAARLKVFAVDIRDTVAKVYATGEGFKVRKESPIPLKGADSINITLSEKTNTIIVIGNIGGRKYTTVQRSPVPIHQYESILITPDKSEIWIKATENGGEIYVELSYSP